MVTFCPEMVAQIAGSVGLATAPLTSAPKSLRFEAIHGSAPRRAGQNPANPLSGLLHAGIMMMVRHWPASRRRKVRSTTPGSAHHRRRVSHARHLSGGHLQREKSWQLKSLRKLWCETLGPKLPEHIKLCPVHREGKVPGFWHSDSGVHHRPAPAKKELMGVDVFVHWVPGKPAGRPANKIRAEPTRPCQTAHDHESGDHRLAGGLVLKLS